MRILILGSSEGAKKFFELFTQDKENIVFSTIHNLNNYIKAQSCDEIVDFCAANEINLVIAAENKYAQMGLQEAMSDTNTTVFSISKEIASIISSRAHTKKFIHKNKIKTPKFQIFEKPLPAMDYIKTVQMPQVIKPNNRSFKECSLFCETYLGAREIINNFFESGNKRIIIEDYIEGKNLTVWALSDGYSARILGFSAKYQNNVAEFEPIFVNEILEEKIYNEVLIPVIDAFMKQGSEYIGILGLDFILSYKEELYLTGLKSFFDDINVDFFTKGFKIDWKDVFESTIKGDVFLKYTPEAEDKFMLTIRQNEEICFISAATRANLERKLKNLDLDLSEYKEAKRIWKY